MAFTSYLKIDLADGSALKIRVESFSFGLTTSPAFADGSVRDRSTPTVSDLTITKLLDTASPALYTAAATGKLLPAVQLDLLPAVQRATDAEAEILETTFTLSDVLVSSVNDAGNQHGGLFAEEEVKFSFQKIEIAVGGNDTFTYSQKNNLKF